MALIIRSLSAEPASFHPLVWGDGQKSGRGCPLALAGLLLIV